MAEIVQLTAEQESEFNKQVSAPTNLVQLTPAQEADFRRQTGTIDPILDFSPEQIAELAKQDTEGFDLVSAFQQNRKLYSDPAIAQKAADALDLIESQTSVIDSAVDLAKHPVKTAGKAIGATIDIGKNMGRIAWRMLTEAPTAVGAAIGERLDRWAGVDPAKTTAVRQEAQRKVAEAWAGIESSTAGLGMQIARAPGKIQQMAGKKRTPEEKLDHLFKRAGEVEQIQLAMAGKGEFMQRVGGDILRELEAAGKPVDPVVASELASGDPFVWWAFGKAFHGVGKATPKIARQASAALGADLGDIAAQAGGRTLQGLGTATKAVATTTGKAAGLAPAAGLVGGLVQGGPVGALAGLKGGEIAARTIKRGAGLVEKAGAQAAEVGKQVAGVTPLTFPVAQVARDVLQTLPAASGMVAKGAALDVGLAALTSETPAEMEHMISVGTALGAVGAGRRVAGRVISGQLIAPRAWGAARPIASSGQFPTLDTLHSNSIRDAAPGTTERLNAVRQFLSGAAPGTDLFFGKDSASIERALLDSGVDPATAKTFSEQDGFFTTELPGRDGTPKPVIIVKSIDAAPHESFHPFQDVIGEGANRSIDEVMKRVYADQWESLGQSYASRLVGQEGTWRDTILNASGWGRAEAIEKIVGEIEKRYFDQTGSPPPEGLAEHEAAETWKRALSEVRQANPNAPMGDLQREAWRGILTEAESTAVADRYLARELAAENFDAAFKNLGPELQKTQGIIPWFARIAAKTTSLLGGEPLAGRESTYGVPLSAEAVQAVTGAARPTVERTTDAPPVVTARRAPASVPATPEARTQAATDAQSIADAAPTAPVAGGTRSPRELLGDIAAAIAQQVGVKINYLSALDEPAAAISSNRAARREMIELFRSMPQSARALWEKTFFPERLIQTGAGIQVLGWAPEVFAANAHKLAKSVGDKSALLPYPVEKGTFTDAGWQELFRDTQTFVRNQLSGQTGAGERLVVPSDLQNRGFYKPPVTGAPQALDQRKADFINLLFGVPLPKTPRITKGKLPLNIAGQDVSVATQPGRVSVPVEPRAKFGEGSEKAREAAEQLGITGREILEVNPLRAELEAAGVKLPGLIEAVQRLDANNIKEVQLAPEQPQFRGNTLTLSAGFQPKPAEPRAVKEAAVRDPKGNIFTGRWHGEAAVKALDAGSEPSQPGQGFEDGFVTNAGEFLSRRAALERAEELQQISKDMALREDFLESIAFAESQGRPDIVREIRKQVEEQSEGQFQPPREGRGDEDKMPMAPGQRLIEVLGPDGTVYKARFDGYQEVPGRAPVAQITPVDGFPWQGDSKRSTTYETTIIKRGFTVPELPTPEQWESERVETGFTQFQPNREVQKVADEYAGRPLPHGIKPPVVNDELARKVADFYESAEHAPADEAVRASYEALRAETLLQLDAIEAAGYVIEPWTGKGEPYKSSADMTADIQENKHLYFKQTGTEMTPDNLMADFNDTFRAVHDFFGHASEGYQFGPRGELAAWNAHSEMYSTAAQGALAAETLAQNSWVNFGKHLEGKNIPLPDRPFAEQKNVIVPAELISEAKAQFQPKRKADESLKFGGTKFNQISNAWILPDNTVKQIGSKWHHEWLDENKSVQEKYGLKIPPFEGGDIEATREKALKKGFVRANLSPSNGLLTVEAREKDWKRIRPVVEDLIEQNLDNVDRFRVNLFDDSVGRLIKSYGEKIFDLDSNKEKMDKVFETFAEQPQGEIGVQFQPRRAEQEQLFGGRELLSSVELGKMTKAEIADHFPEAVIPAKRDEKIPSEITKSPLYKRAGNEESAVAAFADKLAEFANQYKDDPLFKSGSRWYSEFTPMLKREFGADAQLMAELLAATSPQTPPGTNFGYAFDALEGFKSGRFRKTIDKFNQGLDMLAEDRWLSWYNKELKAGRIPEPPAEPTAAAFLEHWIATHDLKPRQSNGKLYGQHSLPVLQVFVRRWLELNKGLKTQNFVENLTGTSHEATIDLWADRTMRRLGYEGRERWRILPQNGTGVSDADFSFAQKAFRAAADKLGMKPDDLQGALWFAEKSLWADNGWGRIDLGDFRKEMEKLPLLRAGVRHRLAQTAASQRGKSAEESELLVEPRKLK